MAQEKVYMLNALWFKKPDGAQRYAEYGAAAGPRNIRRLRICASRDWRNRC